MSDDNGNEVDFSGLIIGKSRITYHDESGLSVGIYLGPGEDGWLVVRSGNWEWQIDPENIITISND